MGGRQRQRDLDDDLRDFERQGAAPDDDRPRVGLGNMPTDLETNPFFMDPSDPRRSPEPEPSYDARTADLDADAESDAERRMRELEERIEAKDRENRLLSLSLETAGRVAPAATAQPRSPVEVIDEYLNGFAVSPEDVQTILADPIRGAQYLQNGIRAAAAAGAALALNQARTEFGAAQREQQTATQLRDRFYSQHPDLEAYPELVVDLAQRIRTAQPHLTADLLIETTARAARQKLEERGIAAASPRRRPTARRAAAPRDDFDDSYDRPAPARRRAPRAEMGSGRGGGEYGRAPSAMERQLRDFERETGTGWGRA